jgi:drug/metabolite transporter (DMT)-like permease
VSIAIQFVLAGVVWGSSFLFMKVALEGISPAQVAGSRLVFGALALGLFVLIGRERLPRRLKVWAHMTVLAVTFCVVPFLLFSWAQQHVTSGWPASTTPRRRS